MPSKTGPSHIQKASGDVDPSHGDRGYQLINLPQGEFYEARGLSIASNNDVLIAGSAQVDLVTHHQEQFILMRRRENGELAEDFGFGGSVSGRFAPDEPAWNFKGIKTLPLTGSNFLLFGQTINNSYVRMASLSSFHANGTPDLGYGEKGNHVEKPEFPSEYGTYGPAFSDGCMQSNGHVVTLYQYVFDIGFWGSLLSRVEPNGRHDPSFNDGRGYNETLTKGGEIFSPTALALQTDDRILVVGNAEDKRGVKGGLVKRFDSNGRADRTFADDGEHRFQNANYTYGVSTADGILLCGSTSAGALLVKLTAEGLPDPDFAGLQVTTPEVTSWTRALTQGANIYAIGDIQDGFTSKAVLACFDQRGKPVDSFGSAGNGRVTLALNGQYNSTVDLVMDNQGRILVLGAAKGAIGATDFFTARFFP